MTFKSLAIIVLLFFISTACKKIATPNDDAKKIFGSWQYDSNSGGYSGTGGSTIYSSNNWVKFTENGYFYIYENEKKKDKTRFKIKMKESIYSTDLKNAIVYRNGNYDTFLVTNDTLYISDEAYDGYTYRFIKK